MTWLGRRGGVAPRLLDPLLALVERIDRARRRIRPVGEGALLGVERRTHSGAAIALSDGTRVGTGDAIWVLHFDNARLRTLAGEGWQTRAYTAARRDLQALAAEVQAEPVSRRPVALSGVTLLVPLARRMGFEPRERGRGFRQRLEDWYLRSLLARWAPDGRQRLGRGHGALRAAEGWLSTGELLRRYGPPPE